MFNFRFEKNEAKTAETSSASAPAQNESDSKKLETIKHKLDENLSYMKHISDTFPRPNGFSFDFYLKQFELILFV